MQAIFISDIHLQPALQGTTQAFIDFLNHQPRFAKELYILGDLFEYWAGDDNMDNNAYLQAITSAIHAVSESGTRVFWICGNRDFLTGDKFLSSIGATALPDTATITCAGKTIAITHGDALCTDDKAYMQFRTMVRNPAWQQQFLSMPLAQRIAVISDMRAKSMKDNQNKNMAIMDVNEDAVKALLAQTNATVLIHGHTHQPGVHTGDGYTRYVLSDWHMEGDERRGDCLTLDEDGTIRRTDLANFIYLN